MIITRTPFRMSFFGGGTDIPEFFEKNRGAVISTTFDKYAYVNVRHLPRFFDYTTELVYSQTERVNSIEEIDHPAIRNAMKMLDMHELRLSYDADLPARTGLGTSSSFAVGMLNAFYCLKGKYRSKKELADDAIYLERTLCNEAGGWQDQIAAAFGGLNRIDFDRHGYTVHPIIISPTRKKELNRRLMLFFTGFTRNSSEIQKDLLAEKVDRKPSLEKILEMVDRAQEILESPTSDFDDFGRLLNESWQLKKSLSSSVSTSAIDKIYERALKAGALGGKLLGAGGGGFLLFYVPHGKRVPLRTELKDLLEVPFQFENEGTQVFYYQPENYDVDGALD